MLTQSSTGLLFFIGGNLKCNTYHHHSLRVWGHSEQKRRHPKHSSKVPHFNLSPPQAFPCTSSALGSCFLSTLQSPRLPVPICSLRQLRQRSFAIKFSPPAKLTPNLPSKIVHVYLWCWFCFCIFWRHTEPSSRAGLLCLALKGPLLQGTGPTSAEPSFSLNLQRDCGQRQARPSANVEPARQSH